MEFEKQCPPLNRITLGQHNSDNNNRMIQLTNVFCVLFRYNGTSTISDYSDYIIHDPNKRVSTVLKNEETECISDLD